MTDNVFHLETQRALRLIRELQAEVGKLRMELMRVRSECTHDVLYEIARVFQRLPERVEQIIEEETTRRKILS